MLIVITLVHLSILIAFLMFWENNRKINEFIKWQRPQKGLCPNCGYMMKGLPSATCPECGKNSIEAWMKANEDQYINP